MNNKNAGIGCITLVGVIALCGIISSLGGGGSAKGTPTLQAAALAPTAILASFTPTATALPTPIVLTMVVGNTGGDGVYIRKSPSAANKLKVWPDGTPMIVSGAPTEAEDRQWRNVKDPDGNIGWIPSEYLAVPTPTPAPTPTPDLSRYKLELLAANGTWGYGFATVEGQVKNISGKPLDNVMVVVEWADDNGNFIKSDDALIEYDPILVGQVSPFKSITSYNPAMTKFRVSFKEMFGGTIPTIDTRKR